MRGSDVTVEVALRLVGEVDGVVKAWSELALPLRLADESESGSGDDGRDVIVRRDRALRWHGEVG